MIPNKTETHWFLEIKFTLLFMAVITSCSGRPQDPPFVLSQCPADVPACVVMLLDAENSNLEHFPTSNQDKEGYTRFTVPTANPEQPELVIRGYTDGMECSAFGQATAAVIAISAKGVATILTSAGPRQLPLTVTAGCRGCLRISGSDQLFTSPSWDITLTGYSKEDFAVLENGAPVLLIPDGCVTLTGQFEFLSLIMCQPILSVDQKAVIDSGACT